LEVGDGSRHENRWGFSISCPRDVKEPTGGGGGSPLGRHSPKLCDNQRSKSHPFLKKKARFPSAKGLTSPRDVVEKKVEIGIQALWELGAAAAVLGKKGFRMGNWGHFVLAIAFRTRRWGQSFV